MNQQEFENEIEVQYNTAVRNLWPDGDVKRAKPAAGYEIFSQELEVKYEFALKSMWKFSQALREIGSIDDDDYGDIEFMSNGIDINMSHIDDAMDAIRKREKE